MSPRRASATTFTLPLVGLVVAAISFVAGVSTASGFAEFLLAVLGVISGGLFAFITSFDEVVVVLFVGSASQKTLPWQMFIGLREQI